MRREEILKFYLSYRLYIFPAIVAFSSLILIIFVIYPQIMSLLTNQKNISDLINRSKDLEVKAQALESLNGEDLSRKVEYALSSYPDNLDFGNVIGLIQNLTTQSGFSAISISIGSSSTKLPNSQSYGIKLDVAGPKSLFSILLTNIERSIRLIRISSVEVTNSQNQQSVNASLSLDILYSPLPGSFGNIDSPLPQLTDKDEQLLATLAKNTTPTISSSTNVVLPPRGKANPFE